MKRLFLACGVFVGLVSLTNCTKNEVLTPGTESVGFTACIDDVNTKTTLNGLKVNWTKGDEIGIQVSRNHTENASSPKAMYPSTYGVYRLADDAAGSNVGRFTYSEGEEKITGDEKFFAFYPSEYCQPNGENGYFYVEFPSNQKYEDVMGGKLPLPMYGEGSNRIVNFKYAGAVIKLQVWAEEGLEAHSCVFSASGLYKKSFTSIKNGKWESLQPAYNVENLKLSMSPPLKISTDANKPTEILMVIPLSSERTLKNVKFSINCTRGGTELKKASDLKITPGSMVTFPVTKLNLETTRMYVDEFEGEFDVEWLKTAKTSVKVTMPESSQLREAEFKPLMEATRSLDHQITLDLSETRAEGGILNGLEGSSYVGFCGGSKRENGIKNVSEFRLPQGITQIKNRAFAYSDYTKIVVPASLTQIAGSPSNGCDKMVWEVAPGNKSFKSDDKGALYDFAMTTLMVLNGGSGSAYTIHDGTTTIREWALYENSVIESLTIPASVTTLSADCISGTPNLTTITCLGTTPAAIKANTGANRVGPKDKVKTLYVPRGCVDAYKTAWKVLLDEGNWEVKEIVK
jgi:hypothetical protein